MTEQLRLSQEAFLNAAMSQLLRDRLIEVNACLGVEFNTLLTAAGQTEGALESIRSTIDPNALSRFFLDPGPDAALEARTAIIEGALATNTLPPPAEGQFRPSPGRSDSGEGGNGWTPTGAS